MSESAIAIEGVSKAYKRVRQAPTSIKQRMMARFTKGGLDVEQFWALRDVSCEIKPGSTLGLIGKNGSGKTTLLKIIAGVLRPTEGTVTSRGRIAALLELGAGFHQELTGRENVYLNASILGLTKKETTSVFDSIVDFADLSEFIDTKVKFYSSGMYVRLGFAVAVHVDPEILLIDEVLAVGDEGFQRKCLDRIQSFQKEGRTIVFVTHVVDQVRDICTEAVMLQAGRVHMAGSAEAAVREYRRMLLEGDLPFSMRPTTKDIEVIATEIIAPPGRTSVTLEPGDDVTVQVDLKATVPVQDPVVTISLHDQHDVFEYGASSERLGGTLGRLDGSKRLLFTLRHLPYTSGEYFLTVAVHSRDEQTVYDFAERCGMFAIPKRDDQPAVAHIETDLDLEDL